MLSLLYSTAVYLSRKFVRLHHTNGAESKAKKRFLTQPFSMQKSKMHKSKKKKPQKRQKTAQPKEGFENPLFEHIYFITKNRFKMLSTGTNLSRFFLFSFGCRVFRCLRQTQEGKTASQHFFFLWLGNVESGSPL